MDKRIFIVIGGVVLLVLMIIGFKIMMSPSDECQKLVIEATPRMMVIGSGEKIQFSDNTPEAKSWLWNFGDGKGTSDLQNPTYEYEASGKYIVQLTVNGKCTDTISVTVKSFIAEADKIVVKIIAPAEAEVGIPVQFTGSAEGALHWYWKFGETSQIDDSTQNPKYTFKAPGIYNVFLKTDNANKPGEWSIQVFPKKKVVTQTLQTPPKPPKESTGGNNSKITPPPPPKPPKETEIPGLSAAEITSHLQVISKQDRMLPVDKKWINDNFILGLRTPIKVTGYKDMLTVNDLIDNMTINPGSVTVKNVVPVIDKARGFVSSLTVNISIAK